MRRLRFALALTAIGVAAVASATQHPNNAKGFNANGVYQMNGLDNINAFNGNLTLTIPIGQAYSIGGGLTYQLRLYANGNVWDSEERYDLDEETNADCSPPPHTEQVPCIHAYPDRRANAGIGFTLSLGRLFPPDEQTSATPLWTYEGPDGSEHLFYPELKPGTSDGDSDVFYTRDGRYLRMRVSGNRRTIEFPSGEVHTFMPADRPPASTQTGPGYMLAPWLVEKIGNRFAPNVLNVTYETENGVIVRYILSDGHRSHTIHYEQLPFESGILDMFSDPENNDPPPINVRMLVRYVDLAAFGSTTPARYTFAYEQTTLRRPDWHTIPNEYAYYNVAAQVLDKLILPDGTLFDFAYVTLNAGGQSGLPWQMKLPTGGRIEWQWGYWWFPAWTASGSSLAAQRPAGVIKRTVYARDNSMEGEWTYDPDSDGDLVHGFPWPTELKVTITDPLQNITENFFDISVLDSSSIDYGLPYTKNTPDGNGRFLSQKFIPAGASTAARSTYVRYERDIGSTYGGDHRNSRLASSRTMYHDDGNAYVDSDSTNYAEFGNYETITTSGTGIQKQVSETDYDSGIPSTSVPWIVGRYSAKAVTEGAKTLRSEYDFDSATGFLRRTRAIKDTVSGARGPSDVITVFTPDTRGDLIREEIYGGDGAAISAANLDLVSLSSGDRVSRVDHEYASGALRRSRFFTSANQAMSFYSVDMDIDSNTGLASTIRDTSGVSTSFVYDNMARLTWEKPTARAWMNYVYPNFSTSTEIVADQYAPGTGGTPGARIGGSRYAIDGLGRVTVTWVEGPGGIQSRRETVFNPLGWEMEVSELGVGPSLPRTYFTRDAFGRVLTATAPDESVTSFTYTGVRTTTRTSRISTTSPTAADTPVTTTEESDLRGRLIRVTEKSGTTTAPSPIGANVITEYGYDPAGRLTSVTMNKGGTAVQQRLFDYDGRGFLRWESHPESGVTGYEYDGSGNVKSKTQSAANSLFDLQYTYDAAGRVLTVSGRNPFYGSPDQTPFRTMKAFTYGTSNASPDLRNGKVITATRYNYGRNELDSVYKIEDTYQYKDAAGRMTDRTTNILQVDSGSEFVFKSVSISTSYNELDLPVTISYPECDDCGIPACPEQLPECDSRREGMVRTYDHGRLISLGRPGTQYFVQNATYWPNGMRYDLTHGNGITDRQIVGNMPRPSAISFGTYDRCVQPRITTQPASVTGGSSVSLSVTVAGTGPFDYEWYNITDNAPAGKTQTIVVNPTVTTEYYVTVMGACGFLDSQVAKVTIGPCSPPSTGGISVVTQPDGSWILRPDPTSRANPTYTWKQLPSNTVVGNERELAIAALTQSTTYSLTISDSCGSSTSNVTISIPLAIPSSGLIATKDTSTQISVAWPAVSGATTYVLERRSGPAWEEIARPTPPTTSHTDYPVQSDKTYAYRVYAIGSGSGTTSAYSNSDVATTRSFTAAVSSTNITPTPTNDMLAAVNSVRAAAGWSVLTWSNILAPNDPLPAPGTIILARHVLSCRARMNEALQALGVPVASYATPDLTGVAPAAAHINEVQQRAQ